MATSTTPFNQDNTVGLLPGETLDQFYSRVSGGSYQPTRLSPATPWDQAGGVQFLDSLVAAVPGPGITGLGLPPDKAGCPVVGVVNGELNCQPPDGSYATEGATVSCKVYRECDPYTAQQHVEYRLPGGPSGNVNIWQSDPATGKLVWIGGSGQPEAPPQWAVPPQLDQGGYFNSFTNSLVVSNLNKFGSTVGMKYDPSAGWTPVAGSAPAETQPTIPAFTQPSSASTPAASTPGATSNVGTASGAGPTVGGTTRASTASRQATQASSVPSKAPLIIAGIIILFFLFS